MTERTTDREALADAQQAGVDAVEAQREPRQSEAEEMGPVSVPRTKARTFEQTKEDKQRAAIALIRENDTLRADVTRLEGERDVLRTALRNAQASYHLARWRESGDRRNHGCPAQDCTEEQCRDFRAALAKGGAQ